MHSVSVINNRLTYNHQQCTPRTTAISFGIMDPDEILKLSVCRVTESTLYERNLPKAGGLNDTRMGTVDRNISCATCGNGVEKCMGHFGHIELAVPMYHFVFIDDILKILRSVCFWCSRLLIDATDCKMDSVTREGRRPRDIFHQVTSIVSAKTTCFRDECQGSQPQYTKDVLAIKIKWSKEQLNSASSPEDRAQMEQPLTAATVLAIFRHIPQEDCDLLGLSFTHPQSLILVRIPVPPPIIRPSLSASEGSKARGQDDLTHKLCDIVKANNILTAQLANDSVDSMSLSNCISDLQYHLATFYVNGNGTIKPSTHRSGQPLKVMANRISGKDARIRGNLMGKRVNMTARSVISPDSNINLDQIGIPRIVAVKLTKPEMVTVYNMDALTACVRKGPGVLGGASRVVKPDGKVIYLEFEPDRETMVLECGWEVHRHLRNGDLCVVNRQPSLHRMSMLAHRIVIMEGKTFRLNLSVVQPYNADFDGDEMNIHIPQTIEAEAELRELMAVSKQIISPQANKPCMGLVQDALTAAFMFTRRDVFLDRSEAMGLLMEIHHPVRGGSPYTLPPPAIVKPRPLWTGKQLFSKLFPPFSLCRGVRGQSSTGNLNLFTHCDNVVYIADGNLLSGMLCKQILGSSSGGVVHLLYNMYGGETVTNFLSDCQRLLNRWMKGQGFSVGWDDCILDTAMKNSLIGRVDHCENLTRIFHEKAKNEGIPPDQVEMHVSPILSNMLNSIGGEIRSTIVTKNNGLSTMVTAGSKGSDLNISMIMGCVGSQSVEGGRIHPSPGENRTLPCFMPHDVSPSSRGFVRNPYKSGLNMAEFFFHAMGGREGLVDTAVKTSQTGYIQRCLLKSMESLRVRYDGTVRDSQNVVVQFSYGHDGWNPTMVEKVSMPWVFNPRNHVAHLSLTEREMFGQWAHSVQRCRFLANLEEISDVAYVPVVPSRLIEQFGGSTSQVPGREEFEEEFLEFFAQAAGITTDVHQLALLVQWCSYHSLCVDHTLSMEQIRSMFSAITTRLHKAKVQAGEMVGCLAAQSIGEPATQMTLNTFHFSGVASKNVTLGIPRLKELINVSSSMATPSASVYFLPEIEQNQDMLEKLADTIGFLTMVDVVRSCEIVHIDRCDRDLLDLYACFLVPEYQDTRCKWVARLVLDRTALLARFIDPYQLECHVRAYAKCHFDVAVSPCTEDQWIMLLRLTNIDEVVANVGDRTELGRAITLQVVNVLLKDIAIGGLAGISKAKLRQVTSSFLDEEEGVVSHRKEWIADTDGSSLEALWNLEFVDWARTISNDIVEVERVLGLEAAIRVLFEEIEGVLSFDGTYVNSHHLMLLVDAMTYRGYLMPLNRHGINRVADPIPMQQASFEESLDMLRDACLFGVTDHLLGPTENIMVGQLAPVGTGIVDVRLDETYYREQLCEKPQEPQARITRLHVQPPKVNAQLVIDALADWNFEEEVSDDVVGGGVPMNEVIEPQVPQVPVRKRPLYRPSSPQENDSFPTKRIKYRPSSPIHEQFVPVNNRSIEIAQMDDENFVRLDSPPTKERVVPSRSLYSADGYIDLFILKELLA